MRSTAPESGAGAAVDPRPVIAVAAGCLIDGRGRVLLAQRPEGKIAAHWWEFPGGKIEAGEHPLPALKRELDEELGIHVEDARPLIRYRHAYSNRIVLLDTWRVTRFSGEPHGRENQALAWVEPAALADWPQCLPTVAPSARALLLPEHYVFTPPDASSERILRGIAKLPQSALLRLRLPALDDAAYHACARSALPAARARGIRVVLDRDPAAAAALGADGWHATAAVFERLGGRAPQGPALQLVSCHDAASLARAAQAGFDAAVLGAVAPTPSHPGGPVLGWAGFEDATQYVGVPVYAIGGVGLRELTRAFSAYGQGVAGISAYWSD